MPFASAAGRTLSSAASSTGTTGSDSSSTRSLPVVIRDMSTRSLTSCACACALRSISSRACRRVLVAEMTVEQHARPAEDHVQRRAQLMGQRRQELVLQAVRFPKPAFGAFMRQVGDDDGHRADAVDAQRDGRQLRRVQRASGRLQLEVRSIRVRRSAAVAASAGRRRRRNCRQRLAGDAFGGRAMSSAKRWLQYRIVPSAASVSAPSRICSTIRR